MRNECIVGGIKMKEKITILIADDNQEFSQTLANYEVLEAEGYGDLGTQALIKYYEEGYNEEIIED